MRPTHLLRLITVLAVIAACEVPESSDPLVGEWVQDHELVELTLHQDGNVVMFFHDKID